MTTLQMFVFMTFVVANTYFSYKAGLFAGKVEGMISITQFFRDKQALKDKQSILGFKNWPEPIQLMYETPDPDKFV